MITLLLAAFIGVDAKLPLGTNGVCDTAAFVKTVTNRSEVVKAEWMVTGLGVFRVWVNGTETGTEDFLKPGLTHVDKRRSTFTYDVTALMERAQSGVNVLAAEVSAGWWRDRVVEAPYLKPKKESGFYGLLKLTFADGSVTEISTDKTWRGAYYSPVTHAEIYWGEDFDARVETAWRKTGNVDWPAAKLNNEFSGELTPMEGRSIKVRRDLTLMPKSIYVWKDVEGASEDRFGKVKILRHGELSGKVDLLPGETLVVDFAQNASGIPEFTAMADKGTTLYARTAEMLNDSQGEKSRGNDGPAGSAYFANYRKARSIAQYTFSGGGKETYMPTFSFFGGRYVSFTATGKVSFSSIRYLPVMSIAKEDETGVLVTGHEGINRLVSNCVWGMRSNFLSVPTDCPQRNERLGWTGDTQAFSGAAVYAADVYGFFMKWMTDMRDTQMQEGERSVNARTPNHPGSFRSVAPPGRAGVSGHRIGWSDAGVIVPYAVWKQFGDTRIVEANWSAMRSFMALLKRTKYITGKKETQTADWLSMEKYEAWRRGWGSKFADNPFWPGETDEDMRRYWDFLGACYRIMDLRMMCEMGKAIGENAAVETFAAEEKEAVAEFRREHLGADGLAPEFLRGMQTPALFLIRLGLLKSPSDLKKTAEELKASIKADGFRPRTGFLGTTILLDTIADDLDDPELAYSVLLQRGCPGWLYSVDQGATTIWERWNGYTKEKGFGPVAMNSFNHYAYGAVMGWMYRTMAGIRPSKDGGYSKFILSPRPDKRLGFCSAEYRTRHGVVKSSWRYNADGTLSYSFTVPEGTAAALRLPGMPEKHLAPGVHEMTVK